MGAAKPAEYGAGAATQVLLLRHAATRWNDQQRRLGWVDHPLTPAGGRAAEAWTGGSEVDFTAVVASDLKRARETAAILAAAVGCSHIVELAGLREQDQGAWTGLTKEQIKRRWPERLREIPRRPVDGEPPEVVLARALAALRQVAATQEGRRVLAITHSGLIRTLERAIGASAPPVPHLEGRWVAVVAPSGAGSEPLVRAGELTAGRRGLTDSRGAALLIAGGR